MPILKTTQLRSAAVYLSKRPRVTGLEIQRFLGHFIPAAMLHRVFLSLPSALYGFVESVGKSRVRLWPSAARLAKGVALKLSSSTSAK